MGGRLDATNVATAELSIITGIGFDHMSSLGDETALIANEKAGIIKEGRPVVVGPLDPEARRVIERVSKERSARLVAAGEDFVVEADQSGEDKLFSFRFGGEHYKGLEVALRGAHQQCNAGVAIAALSLLSRSGFNTKEEDIREGLKRVEWPGRCEIVRLEPTLLFDCAHNESAAEALTLALEEFTYSRLILVIGIMKDKDIGAILSHLAPLADSIIFTRADMERAEEPEKLLNRLRELSCGAIEATVVEPVSDALRAALSEAGRDDLVCLTGSVFVVGEARSNLQKIAL